MRARLDHLIGELDFAFYEICCHEWVYLGLLLASALAALACAVADYRSATLAGRAAWAGGFLLSMLFHVWLVGRRMPDGG